LSVLRGLLVVVLLVTNVVLWGTPILLVGLVKLFIRGELRRRMILVAAWHGDQWVAFNNIIFDTLLPTRWDISVAEGLKPDRHYLIVSNHRSWTDILVLFRAFHRRVAFIRFFLKHELIWSPIVGQACWALDFPFMKRYSPEYLARHPEKRGMDLETTRRACRRYRRVPVAILNFLEGTRFTEEKREEQRSPYRFLLRPRIGGVGFVLASLGDQLDGVIDVTVAYPDYDITIWDFVCGRVPNVTVRAHLVDVPEEFLSSAIVEQGPARERFKAWVEAMWSEKDRLLSELVSAVPES
jgi:1-acyl-sn-glycerol-3-phosphate acyltransferase